MSKFSRNSKRPTRLNTEWEVNKYLVIQAAKHKYLFFLSFFLSFSVWPLLPTHCRQRGLLLITVDNTRWDSSGRELGPSQRFLSVQHNIHKRQTSMPPAGFKPAIPASERLQTYALDHVATGIGQTRRHQHKKEMRLCNWSTFEIFRLAVICGTCIQYGNDMFVSYSTKGCTTVLTGQRIEVSCLLWTRAYTDRRPRTEMTAVTGGGIVNH